jgi:ribosomal protein L11 methyltransferase
MRLPYQDLHIYEISGEVLGSKHIFKEDFLGCWNEGEISFLFFSAPHDQEVQAFVRGKGLTLRSKDVLDYRSWQAGDELKPFKVGHLVICPPWETWSVEEGEVLVHLDPCVVFGTGYHPTTRTCLMALLEIYQKEKPKIVLDLGTGSGILALAAAKLGAERVLAVDCNELAAETASRNVLRNNESDRIEVKQGWAEEFIGEEADLVCANIHLQIVEALFGKKGFFTKRWIILSGIFIRDAEEIERRLKENSIEIFQRFREKTWITWIGVNRSCKGG